MLIKKIYKATMTIEINLLLKFLIIFFNEMLYNSMNWMFKKNVLMNQSGIHI